MNGSEACVRLRRVTGRAAVVGAIATLAALGVGACRQPSAPKIEGGFPIVLILIDALRADRVNTEGGNSTLVPNLASLARDGVTFRNAFASAPKTIPSVPQMFTSRHFPDLHHDVTLISVCKDAGYEATGAFIHNPYVSKWLGRVEPTFDRLGGGEYGAARLTDDAIGWLQERPNDRVALYVHYLDVHMPLQPPAGVAARFIDPTYRGPIGLEFGDAAGAWAGRYDDDDKRRIGHLYDATIAATDAQVGRLLDVLREQGLYDEALIVVTADHGEELWDHGSFFHGHSLYDELLRVPLIVKFPSGWKGGVQVDALARVVDVLPTVTDLLARDSIEPRPAPGPMDGESLVPLVTGGAPPRTLFATVGRVDDRSPPLHAVRTAKTKLIVDMRSGEEQLFDLERDPAERDNLAARAESAATLAAMRRELASSMKDLEDAGVHVRLTNGTASPLRYRLEVVAIVPFVNLARFDMEAGDRLEQRPRADGVVASGVLEPGDSDRVRFDVLASKGELAVTLTTDEGAGPLEVCVGEEPACAPAGERVAGLTLARMESTEAPAVRPTSALQMQWWLVRGTSEPIAPALSAADRERLRALGYAE